MDLSANVVRYGTREPLVKPIELRAGPLTLRFEPDTTYLRHFRLGDFEVVRAIYGAIRDENWTTIVPELSNVKVQDNNDSFHISFDAQCSFNEVSYFWKAEINGSATGEVTYEFFGEAHSDFLRNRIGLCVLHPIPECSGKKILIESPSGSKQEGTFPKEISPHQPFLDIRAVTYWVHNGVEVTIRVEGDTFEMEDQRNWGDASFKTYSTPLSIPIPAPVKKGDRVEQKVSVKISNLKGPVLPVVYGRPAQISIATTPVYPLPPIGLQCASHGQPLTSIDTEKLQALKLNHLRIDLRLAQTGWLERLQRGIKESQALGCNLYLGLIFCDSIEKELGPFIEEAGSLLEKVNLFLLFHEKENPIRAQSIDVAQKKLKQAAPRVLIGAGTLDFFTEINRFRPSHSLSAFPVWSINPQVHAFDNTTLVENMAGFPQALTTAQTFCPQPPVISPITMRCRCSKGSFKDADPRQSSLLGAGWTATLIGQLSVGSPVHSLTFFQTTGCLGLFESDKVTPHPEGFPTQAGLVFPVYHVFADLVGFHQVYPASSSLPLQVQAIALANEKGERRIIIANFLNESQPIKIKSGSAPAMVKVLSEETASEAMKNYKAYRSRAGTKIESVGGKIELELSPFAVATVDLPRR